MIHPIAAGLPDPFYILIGCIVVAVAALVGIGMLLKWGRELRTNLAEELKREMNAGKEATKVNVQQPFVVTPHQKTVSQDQHDELRDQVAACATSEQLLKVERELKEDLTKQAGARKKMHEEVGALQGDVKKLTAQGEILATQQGLIQVALQHNTALTAATKGTMDQMNLQLQQLNGHLLRQAAAAAKNNS